MDENSSKIVCPKCGSCDVDVQVVQENLGGKTKIRTKSKYKEKGHGFIWWLTIGWWWWIVDLFSWILFFVPRLVLRIFASPFKKKKYEEKSKTVSTTRNKIQYKSVFLCKSCGHHWEK